MANIEVEVIDLRVVDLEVPLPPGLVSDDVDLVNIVIHFPNARPKKVTVPGHYFVGPDMIVRRAR